MKNIHLFETKDAFDKAKSSLILPTVSYIKENKDVKYNPTFDANGHDFVEIAGIKWATMNVGASKPSDYGLYFQWGDTQGYTADQVGTGDGQKKFSWADYNTYLRTKYNKTDMTLETVDDAVHAAWGGSWRMPTHYQMMELINTAYTTSTWTTQDGIKGRLFTSKNNGKSIFIPACGNAGGGAVYYTGFDCGYWLSSLYADDVSNAYFLGFGRYGVGVGNRYRCYGLCVRGVLAEN